LATKKIRVHELARELGLTNKETLDLSVDLGIGVKSHSSSIEDPQADRVRRKADQLGLRRDVQPEEPKKDGSAAVAPPEPAEPPSPPAVRSEPPKTEAPVTVAEPAGPPDAGRPDVRATLGFDGSVSVTAMSEK